MDINKLIQSDDKSRKRYKEITIFQSIFQDYPFIRHFSLARGGFFEEITIDLPAYANYYNNLNDDEQKLIQNNYHSAVSFKKSLKKKFLEDVFESKPVKNRDYSHVDLSHLLPEAYDLKMRISTIYSSYYVNGQSTLSQDPAEEALKLIKVNLDFNLIVDILLNLEDEKLKSEVLNQCGSIAEHLKQETNEIQDNMEMKSRQEEVDVNDLDVNCIARM